MNAFVGGLLLILIPPCTAQKNSVGFQTWKKGDTSDIHYQRVSVEYNLLVSGKLISNGKHMSPVNFLLSSLRSMRS